MLLFLNHLDRLAALTTALGQTKTWSEGSTYMTRLRLSSDPNPRFSKGDVNLHEAMQVPSGTESLA